MRLKTRLARERLTRLRQRAHSATLRPATGRIELAGRSPVREWYLPAGASGACGTSAASHTWTDKPCGRRLTERVELCSHISVRRTGGFPFDVRLGNVSAGGCKVELVEGTEVAERVIARFPGLEPSPSTKPCTPRSSRTCFRALPEGIRCHSLLGQSCRQ